MRGNPNLKQYAGMQPVTNGPNSQLPGAFHNAAEPKWDIKRERPIHRVMAELAVTGADNKEIAAATGYHKVSVSNILRQPFVQAHMIDSIKENAKSEINRILERAAPVAMLRIVEDAGLVEDADLRLKYNREILDRFLGRASQPLSVEQKDLSKLSDAELEAIAAGANTGTATSSATSAASQTCTDEPS